MNTKANTQRTEFLVNLQAIFEAFNYIFKKLYWQKENVHNDFIFP